MSIHLELPLRLRSLTNQREHWAARARRTKRERSAARIVARSRGAAGLALPLVVTIVRIAPRRLDDDNLRGACKAVRDGLADALDVDDADSRVTWRYEQRKGRPREYAVEVRITEEGEA